MIQMMTRSRRARRRRGRGRLQQGGFTMMEIMIAMLLLSVVLVGLAGLQIATIRQVALGQRANGALRLAQAVIEKKYQSVLFDDLPSANSPDWELELKPDLLTPMSQVAEDGIKAGPFTVHRFIERPTSGDRVITVRVSWLDIMPGTDPTPGKQYRTLDVMLTLRRTGL